ncbi:MAG: hypothetical protein B7Z37_01580 [Verrucomicrobia bacterium 12-59-8]|nr:MAG: hypothetical protein B7Z37_01580 [Verrucomicrobia bacterium 12-59-8]
MKYLLIPTFIALLSLTSVVRGEEGTLEVNGLTFKFATPWGEIQSTGMFRAGTLAAKVEGAEKPVEAVFYSFPGPGGGGDTEANVKRWLGQFQGTPESKREELVAGDSKITLVTATGTYNDGPPMGAKTPRENYSLIAAIVPAGETNIFVKLTGPKDAITKLAEDFKKIILSPFIK